MTDELRLAMSALSKQPSSGTRSVTSDLSVDESLLLHGAGFEPTDLVCGVSVQSIAYGTFRIPYGQGDVMDIPIASRAVTDALHDASERLRQECAKSGGQGVVGVDVEVEIEHLSAVVTLTGTAIRSIHGNKSAGSPFITDLSTKDFVLLRQGGWKPLDFVYGAGFVGAPIQGMRQSLSQMGQNVELTNLTRALQGARETAMERMQHRALQTGGTGVVDVSIIDGPLGHSRHVFMFVCYGTAVQLEAERHQFIEPDLVLPLDDNFAQFDSTALRGR